MEDDSEKLEIKNIQRSDKAKDTMRWSIHQLEQMKNNFYETGNYVMVNKLQDEIRNLQKSLDLWEESFNDVLRMYYRK
jgi:hypothetical protein